MSILLKAAEDYVARGFSVIPLKPDKTPLVKWEAYQKEQPTENELQAWFIDDEDTMIGIVTGKISGLTVIDVDTDAGKKIFQGLISDRFRSPIVITPRGGFHIYCRYEEGVRNKAHIADGIDIRSEGGYVVAPPSVNQDGKAYSWGLGFSLDKAPLPKFPKKMLDMTSGKTPEQTRKSPGIPGVILPAGPMFVEGRRDEDLFHVANSLVKSGLPTAEVEEILMNLAAQCDPPFSPVEARAKVCSAMQRTERKEAGIQAEVMAWIEGVGEGYFSINDVFNTLPASMGATKNAIRVALHRLCKDEVIKADGSRAGQFRRLVKELDVIDWQHAPTEEYPIELPLYLNQQVCIYPRSVILVAGATNSGKTAFCLNVVRKNMMAHPDILYLNSEMGATELRIRLGLFEDIKQEDWHFTPVERSAFFHDAIKPDLINIVDYLEVNDEFWKVGAWVNQIYRRLDKGIAIVCIQKSPGKEYGRGGDFGSDKPRLYMSMDQGVAKIIKAKAWRNPHANPNGRILNFKLIHGSIFQPDGDWHYPPQEAKPWVPGYKA